MSLFSRNWGWLASVKSILLDWTKKSYEEILALTTEEVFVELSMYYQHSDGVEAERKAAEKKAMNTPKPKS